MDTTKELNNNDGSDNTLEKLLSADNGNNNSISSSTSKESGIINDILNKKDEKKNDDNKNDEDDDDTDDNTTTDEDKKINSTEDADALLIKATKYKEDGNTYFKNGDYDKAARSYRRGCSTIKNLNENNNGDVQVKSLLINLQTNMSMVFFKQTKYKQSKEMASSALLIDKTHVKGLYRRGVAYRKMGDVDLAKVDLKSALVHEPTNKQVRKELLLIKQELESIKIKEKKALQAAFSNKNSNSFLYQDKEEEIKKKKLEKEAKKQREREAKEKRKKEWEDECVQKLAKNEEVTSFEEWDKAKKRKEKEERDEIKRKKELERAAASNNKPSYKPSNNYQSSNNDSDSDDSELDEKELASLRGYKKTSDGKTTSYFNRELSHTEKALVGDNAPKKLENVHYQSSITSANNNASTTKTQSAWNAAQTWEERDTTDWCIASLIKHLKNTSIPSQLSSLMYTTKITKVDPVSGHSSFVLTSGRKRYIFDFSATVVFSITSSPSPEDATSEEIMASGSFILPDISSGIDNDHHQYEIEIKWDVIPKKAMIQDVCKNDFCGMIRNSVKSFVLDFNSHY